MTTDAAIRLPGPLVLVPATSLAASIRSARAGGKQIPSEVEWAAELNRLNFASGVPTSRDGKWLRIYLRRHLLGVSASSRGDAWVVGFIRPLGLRDYETLGRGVLRVHVDRGWSLVGSLPAVPAGARSCDADLRRKWAERTATTKPAGTRSSPGANFCDELDAAVDVGLQVEKAKRQTAGGVWYSEVESVGLQRGTAASVYAFRLAAPGPLRRDTLVEVKDAEELRGRVERLDEGAAVVRFSVPIDRRRIPEQGELLVSGGAVLQRAQKNAVSTLRRGESANPRLLDMLTGAARPVEGRLPGDKPTVDLDPDQRKAFDLALSGPDMLLILGPPGTGKTTTITEIACACVRRGERVLISSQTNRAVDNVLERLPAEVRSVRVGNEARISDRVSHLTVPALAAAIRTEILDLTRPAAGNLAPWATTNGIGDGWLRRLATGVGDLRRALDVEAIAVRAHEAAVAAIQTHFAPRLEEAERVLTAARTDVQRKKELVDGLAAAHRRASAKSRGVLGPFYRWRERRLQTRLATAATRLESARQAEAAAGQAASNLAAEVDRAVRADPATQSEAHRVTAARAHCAVALKTAREAADGLYPLLALNLPGLPAPQSTGPGLTEFHQYATAWQPFLARRAALLDEWREQLDQSGEELHHELICYADVVGATCIGVGMNSNRIADQVFDVVIIDEAAQIALPSTVVPLVRGRRIVLVGDHHQLPPFVDSEVDGWLSRHPRPEQDSGRLRQLLTVSAFERIHHAWNGRHTVQLTGQRRMPRVVADFVSAEFYDGRLSTHCEREPVDELFSSCLALVDTSDLPPRERAERHRAGSETWQAPGYDNPSEANLILDLIQWYTRVKDCDWAVIVPYNAQVQYLRQRLGEMIGDPRRVAESVGTVDAFQGGERDIVIYGFTRSNPGRKVGFLAERRRLNVAMTRARQQLVLIGDSTTLLEANDEGFATLARALYVHASEAGDIQASRDLRTGLRRMTNAL